MFFAVDNSNLRGPMRVLMIVGAMLLSGRLAFAAPWNAELGTGQQISVSPTDNRAVIESGRGQGKPLWDGVHRLSDGSTITIRSGILVPNEALQTYQAAPGPPSDRSASDQETFSAPAGRRGSCDELVLSCCGLHGSCEDAEACVLARQLRRMQHQPDSVRLGNADWAEQQCREALQDHTRFTTCAREPSLETTACRQLLDRVCADRPRCGDSPSCRMARELFDLEQAALDSGAEMELEVIRPRCLELLGDHAFFPPCR
jgi:hypothetical protein